MNNETTAQRCRRCNVTKPFAEFDLKRKPSKRYKKMCRVCCRLTGKEVGKRARELSKENREGTSYLSRNENLKRLGYPNYATYLASDQWKEIRKVVYRAKGSDCVLCGDRATELHHTRYHPNDLTGKHVTFIHPVCRACHVGVEFDGDDKLSVAVAEKKFSSLYRKRKRELKRRP